MGIYPKQLCSIYIYISPIVYIYIYIYIYIHICINIYIYITINIHITAIWPPKTMKNKGFGNLKARVSTIKTSKHVGPWWVKYTQANPNQKKTFLFQDFWTICGNQTHPGLFPSTNSMDLKARSIESQVDKNSDQSLGIRLDVPLGSGGTGSDRIPMVNLGFQWVS